ncbi:MAG: hypothetical protein H6615_07645 [Ignavibacteria bacterium]|nr:hypothetical protein [Ignavibacteria bacterium]
MKEFKLIDSSFTNEEARAVLLSLINYKIQFHSQKIFSSYIRFGRDDIKSKNRIVELEAIKQKLVAHFDNIDDPDGVVRVSSVVNMNAFLEIEDGATV